MFRIAIVDDEPTLVESLCDMLEQMLQTDTEFFKFFSADGLCQMLQSTPVDLIVSDICMPGMDGLQMLPRIEELCPKCRLIFLTSYATFSYAQEALRHTCCVDYVLKTQGDQAIVAAIEKQLILIEAENTPQALLDRAKTLQETGHRETLKKWLTCKQGILPAQDIFPHQPTLVCCIRRTTDKVHLSTFILMMEQLLHEHLNAFPFISVVEQSRQAFVCLAQRDTNTMQIESIYAFVRARLEQVQIHMEDSLSFAFSAELCDVQQIPLCVSRLHQMLLPFDATGTEVILEERHVANAPTSFESDFERWLLEYIHLHLDDINLSLSSLAEATHYSTAYLSRLIRQRTGGTFSSYLAQARLHESCRLLREGKMKAQSVGRAVGYESPSYFSAFFRRMMGMSPTQYQRDYARK